MRRRRRSFCGGSCRGRREGAVTVEMAVLSPVFLILMLGTFESTRLLEVQNVLSASVRDGARLAAMDRRGVIPEGVSTNAKIEQDVRNFLDAAGLPGSVATIEIVAASDGTPFNLDDIENDLELFVLRVDMPYSAINPFNVSAGSLRGEITFRNARAYMTN